METQLAAQNLAQFVDYLIEAIGSGRLGFDDAVSEYATHPGPVSSALQPYVQAMAALGKSAENQNAMMETRRVELRAFSSRLNTPEANAMVEALIHSQDQRISLLKTLEELKTS